MMAGHKISKGEDKSMGYDEWANGGEHRNMHVAADPTATELLTLQDTLGRALRKRNQVVNAAVTWPVDALADELDALMHDIAFERYGKWLCPIAGYLD
jgi:hypothetical protein